MRLVFGSDSTVHLLKSYEVLLSDTLESVIRRIANDLVGHNLIVGTNYGSFDIISREQKAPSGVSVNCQDINNVTGYSVAIV